MKKFILATFALVALSTGSYAQKFCFVDSKYILENIPEYKAAQDQLDQVSVEWQKEIEEKFSAIDRMYKDYQKEEILLTEKMKKKRQDEIIAKEKEAKELQKKRFGFEGDLFKKRQELVKPIQDKVFNACKEIAIESSYAFILDKSSDLIMLYASEKFDKSDDVLKKLGYKPGVK